MSEVLTQDFTETEYRISMSDNSGNEYTNPALDDSELTNLVSANAFAIVEVQWAPSVKQTLQDAMHSAPPINIDNIDWFVGEVQRALAAAEETEEEILEEGEEVEEGELEEETVEPEEPVAKAKEPKQKVNAKTKVQKEPTKPVADKKQPESQVPKPRQVIEASKVQTPTGIVGTEPQQSNPVVAKPKMIDSSLRAAQPEAPVVKNRKPESPAPELVVPRANQESEPLAFTPAEQLSETETATEPEAQPEQQIPTLEILDLEVTQMPVIETKPALAVDQEAEHIMLPALAQATIEPTPTEQLALNPEPVATQSEALEFDEQIVEEIEAEPTIDIFDYQEFAYDTLDFIEDAEIVLDHFEELSEVEVLSNVQPVEIVEGSIETEQVEDALILLSEFIEASEPAVVQEANEIIDKIIEAPAKLETYENESTVQVEEELEQLFAELLDIADIDYTPELIESLAQLTINWHVANQTQKPKPERILTLVPPADGTHEIITKLPTDSNNLRTLGPASALGKSALWLYSLNLAA